MIRLTMTRDAGDSDAWWTHFRLRGDRTSVQQLVIGDRQWRDLGKPRTVTVTIENASK